MNILLVLISAVVGTSAVIVGLVILAARVSKRMHALLWGK